LIEPNAFSGGIGRNSISINAFHYELGAYLRRKIGKSNEIALSTVFTPSQNLNATASRELYTAQNINTLTTYDTLDYDQTVGKVSMGLESKYGIAYQFSLPNWKRKTRVIHPQLIVLASYTTINPSSHDFTNLAIWKNMMASKIGLGLQFKPEAKLYENITTLKFLEKITYRFGAYSFQLPYATATGNQYIEQALSFGFGVPILAQQGLSSLNLSLLVGNRGVNQKGYTSEEFLSFNFGLVISPSSFDRWFRKRKLD
jgi:hypothetical protein